MFGPKFGPKPENYIGLMSGTSLDGVDGVIADFSSAKIEILAHAYSPFTPALRAELLALNTAGDNELHRAALAENALARAYAQVVAQLLQSTPLERHQIAAIGAHGQTVRHRPQAFDADPARQLAGGYTLQLNNPALLAELTGIDVVADFRRRDVAAGGQGAPLVPAFHRAVFGEATESVTVLNIGGISNITLLNAADAQGDEAAVAGFDCGPGNALMDHWCHAHTGQPFDDAGRWAASGQVHAGLLASLIDEAYFRQSPPKSTGRDLFNVDWLTGKLAPFNNLKPVEVQATLTELTARVCSDALRDTRVVAPKLIICGGGALNTHLMERLAALSGLAVESSQLHGLPPLQVEAAAFAWLARKCIKRETGNVPKVTGALGARILGAVYPA
jgi:anhydro-N-acetylmuramic acid kinase